MAESALKLQEELVKEIARRKKLMLFMNGPDGASSEIAKEFLRLNQKEALDKLWKGMAVADTEETVNFEVIGDPPGLS